jgi:tetratricopeptide (TPR) repeat protein
MKRLIQTALCLYKLKKYEKVVEDFSKAIQMNSDNAVYFNSRGYALSNMKRYADALADFDVAIRLNLN